MLHRISRRSCELYWGEAWLSLFRALEARSLATELIRILRTLGTIQLLDAGSGDGRFYDLLSYAVDNMAGQPLMSTVNGFGLERGPNKSAGIRKRGSPLIPIRGDLRALPLHDGVMDVILCNSTLEHIGEMEIVLREFSRVLRPGGYLLITVPSINFEHLLFRYRILCLIGEKTASRFAKNKSAQISHLHYLHPRIWAQHLESSLLPMVSWRPIVPSAVVAWGDILSVVRDVGLGGGRLSLRRPGRRFADIPLRILRRVCIEAEHVIAHLSGCLVEREPMEGVEGAYLIVAQRGWHEEAFASARSSVVNESRRILPQMIAADLVVADAEESASHS